MEIKEINYKIFGDWLRFPKQELRAVNKILGGKATLEYRGARCYK